MVERRRGREVEIKKPNGDHCMVERRGGTLNKEAGWRPLYGGAQGKGKA